MSLLPEILELPPKSSANLTKSWSTGLYLQARAFRNAVIDEVLRRLERDSAGHIGATTLALAWTTTPEDSTIRNLLTDYTLWRTHAHRFDTRAPTWPPEIVMAAAKRYIEGKGKAIKDVRPTFDLRCQYHEHGEGEEKCN